MSGLSYSWCSSWFFLLLPDPEAMGFSLDGSWFAPEQLDRLHFPLPGWQSAGKTGAVTVPAKSPEPGLLSGGRVVSLQPLLTLHLHLIKLFWKLRICKTICRWHSPLGAHLPTSHSLAVLDVAAVTYTEKSRDWNSK